MWLDYRTTGSIMHHTRPDDMTPHGHSSVALLCAKAEVTLAHVHANASITAPRLVCLDYPLVRGDEPYVRSP
jgi:hypothetical protein